ncbi:hypothetical protein F4782DRAFT_535235 [Xylaria castorea]|nr:hypothetical protein F4782DRAFT_535235 [Xylaria castorea]
MSEEINVCLVNRQVIPESALTQFKPGHVPVVLQIHNRHVRKSHEPNLCGAILREEIAELMSGNTVPQAVVIDGIQNAFYGTTSAQFRQVLQDFAPSFSGLTIYIRCPKHVALRRYLLRGRPNDSNIDSFEKRMKNHDTFTPKFLNFVGTESVVIETTNDDTMTIDEAYQTLLSNLDEVPRWKSLIGVPPAGDRILDSRMS